MRPHKIIVRVKPDGTFTSEIRGIKGPACTEIAKLLEAVGQVTEAHLTPEFDECETTSLANTVSA